MIKKLKCFKKLPSKFVLVSVSMALGLSLNGCSFNNNNYEPLDINKIDSNTVSYDDIEDFYKDNVDSLVENMSDEEKEKYFVKVNLNYIGAENYHNDLVDFLRNDDESVGYFHAGEDSIEVPPGIYRISSTTVVLSEKGKEFGDIQLLVPGEDVDMTIDYNNKSLIIDDDYRYYYNHSKAK